MRTFSPTTNGGSRWFSGLGLTAFFLAILASAAACGGGDGDDGASLQPSGPKVAATTVQIAALTTQVAGDRVRLTEIIPAGSDPHEFEPSAEDLKSIAEADLILRHGIGLDSFLDGALGGSSAPVVTVTDGLPLEKPALQQGDPGGTAGSPDESEFDPHVWHDPFLDQMMVDNIRDALIQVDPDGREVYEANAEAYKHVLDETDGDIRQIIGLIPEENRKIVTNHDALGYFARRYNLQIVGAVIPGSSTQAEPSAGETAALLETIQREGVRAIFAESSVNADLARQLAGDAQVAIIDDLYGDTLGEPGSEAGTIHGMLLYNARLIADGLKG